ncbi:unnamed protein product, partial [Oppiella nova]
MSSAGSSSMRRLDDDDMQLFRHLRDTLQGLDYLGA